MPSLSALLCVFLLLNVAFAAPSVGYQLVKKNEMKAVVKRDFDWSAFVSELEQAVEADASCLGTCAPLYGKAVECGAEIGLSLGLDDSCLCDSDFASDMQTCFGCVLSKGNASTGVGQANSQASGLLTDWNGLCGNSVAITLSYGSTTLSTSSVAAATTPVAVTTTVATTPSVITTPASSSTTATTTAAPSDITTATTTTATPTPASSSSISPSSSSTTSKSSSKTNPIDTIAAASAPTTGGAGVKSAGGLALWAMLGLAGVLVV